jgi:malonyl-CoA decarboxylase
MRSGWFLQDLMATIADQSRQLLPSYLFGGDTEEGLQQLIEALVAGRGEASGVAVAQQLLKHYRLLEDDDQRLAFFRYLARRFEPDVAQVSAAAAAYAASPSAENFENLERAVDSRRQEFFRRLNLAPGGTAEIVHMRKDLLRLKRQAPELDAVDRDIVHLLQSWFNRGFLVLRRIDWQTPAAILDKIIQYEAVHAITGWEDLKRRLDPIDRRCFAFFHPAMSDEPLIFVEVALMTDIPETIDSVLKEDRKWVDGLPEPTTAVFYSISNCQEGLKGISFGNFLIKQVVQDLIDEHAGLTTFVTLSPAPRLAGWIARDADQIGDLTDQEKAALAHIERATDTPIVRSPDGKPGDIEAGLTSLAVRYFLTQRSPSGQVIDPVARFHLGNGARLERINIGADLSAKGLEQAHGVMVNYLYEPREIEQNHEAFANEGVVAASRTVRNLQKRLPSPQQQRQAAPAPAE